MDNRMIDLLRRMRRCGLRSDRIVEFGFFNMYDLALFSILIDHRRPLPVYLGGRWRCYDCHFESAHLAEMVRHVLKAHEPAPFNPEDELEGELICA